MTSLLLAAPFAMGLVTSPAVKLSPNARNRVRDKRGVGVGVVGGVESPHATQTAIAAIQIAEKRIQGMYWILAEPTGNTKITNTSYLRQLLLGSTGI